MRRNQRDRLRVGGGGRVRLCHKRRYHPHRLYARPVRARRSALRCAKKQRSADRARARHPQRGRRALPARCHHRKPDGHRRPGGRGGADGDRHPARRAGRKRNKPENPKNKKNPRSPPSWESADSSTYRKSGGGLPPKPQTPAPGGANAPPAGFISPYRRRTGPARCYPPGGGPR